MSKMTIVSNAPTAHLSPAGRRPGADTGDPQIAVQTATTNAIGNIGVWECEPGGWPVIDRPDTEVAYIVSGTATLTEDGTGATREVTAGDLIVLPPGWTGRWDVTETVRKVYAIY
jgi:uncharacterized cupin superfamily protein